MSLRDKVAQLIIMPDLRRAGQHALGEFRRYQHYVRDLHVGGIIVTGHSLNGGMRNAEPYAMAALLNRLQKMSRTFRSSWRRFRARRVDARQLHHRVAVQHGVRRGAGSGRASHEEGAETARDARAMGVNWLFAPVADVNNNPDNPIINIRSFGENPAASLQLRRTPTSRARIRTARIRCW